MSRFIVFEGLDGSGKTTQLRMLADYLKKKDIPFMLTKEPTDNPIGRLARNVIRGVEMLSEEALSLLFLADRAEHTIKEIRPALKNGTNIICDRYIYSNIAYQNITLDNIDKNNFLIPDLTVFIDTSPEECTRRINNSRPAPEIYDGMENAVKIRKRYLCAFDKYFETMPVEIVNGSRKKDEVFSDLLKLGIISGICG